MHNYKKSNDYHKYKFVNNVIEIYRYRNVLFSLIHKDLFGRYRNSFLGFAWHFINPMIMMAIYCVVYSSGIRSSPIDNFVIYTSSVLFPFSFLTSNLTGGAGYITGSSGVLKKMYFPREIVVLSHIISTFIIMIVGYTIVFLLMVITGFVLNPLTTPFIIVIFVLMFFFAFGYSLLFSSLTVYVRDVQYFLSAINIIFIFVTPMYFTVSSISGTLSEIVWLNPFTYFIEAIHCCIYFGTMPGIRVIIVCVLMTLISLIIGILVFKKLKHGFTERL